MHRSRSNNRKRKRQAQRAADIYREARQRSDLVIVAGDLNDTPDSDPLEPLLTGTDLRDVMAHPRYDGKPGTYETGNSVRQKIDYLLLSPALWDVVTAVGVERRGIWAPNTFKPFDTVKRREHSASDHAAVWVDLGVG